MKKSIVSGKLNHKSQQSGAAGNLPLWRKPKAVLCGAGFRGSLAQAYSPRDLFKLSLAINIDSHLECVGLNCWERLSFQTLEHG